MPAADNQSLRGFVEQTEKTDPANVLRITEPVSQQLEMTATVFELDRLNQSPAVIFEKVAGFYMPVVPNVAGNRELLARCLDSTVANLPTAFRERCQKYIPSEIVSRPSWDEIVIEGDDVDLTRLPIPFQFTIDAAPYITTGPNNARDPATR